MSDLANFLLGGEVSECRVDLITLTHPNFSQDYILQNAIVSGDNFTVPNHGQIDVDYFPFRVRELTANNVLTRGIDIEIGDISEIITREIKNLDMFDGYLEQPSVTWHQYRSGDLTKPLFSTEAFSLIRTSRQRRSTSIEARSGEINASRSGERYLLTRFRMQIGV